MSGDRLFYIHDPMCSWCRAFQPVWQQLRAQLPDTLTIRYLLGGLAADSDQPMSSAMQRMVSDHWRRIERVVPGTEFNFDFWQHCTPRRSTWPACRAVIAARYQAAEQAMIQAIGDAYYLQAQNPSDDEVLIACAATIGLDVARFKQDLNSDATRSQLQEEMTHSVALGASGFPSLILERGGQLISIPIDYNDATPMQAAILRHLSGAQSE